MIPEEFARALLLERYGRPVREWKPQTTTMSVAAQLDLLAEDQAHEHDEFATVHQLGAA